MDKPVKRRGFHAVHLLLLLPFAALLWVPSYNRTEPELAGIPFFYWYQMLWVLISTVLTMTAYKLWQRDQRTRHGGNR